jgi:hypothetical protein
VRDQPSLMQRESNQRNLKHAHAQAEERSLVS